MHPIFPFLVAKSIGWTPDVPRYRPIMRQFASFQPPEAFGGNTVASQVPKNSTVPRKLLWEASTRLGGYLD
jgi:hypothetical protein